MYVFINGPIGPDITVFHYSNFQTGPLAYSNIINLFYPVRVVFIFISFGFTVTPSYFIVPTWVPYVLPRYKKVVVIIVGTGIIVYYTLYLISALFHRRLTAAFVDLTDPKQIYDERRRIVVPQVITRSYRPVSRLRLAIGHNSRPNLGLLSVSVTAATLFLVPFPTPYDIVFDCKNVHTRRFHLLCAAAGGRDIKLFLDINSFVLISTQHVYLFTYVGIEFRYIKPYSCIRAIIFFFFF